MSPVRTLYMILGALAYRFDKILHFAAHSRLVQNDRNVWFTVATKIVNLKS
jgi:hypothetical protein